MAKERGRYDLKGIRYGSSWSGPTITIPDLSGIDGPSSISLPTEVTAFIKPGWMSDAEVEIDVEVLDPLLRIVKLRLTAEDTRSPFCEGVWYLQVKNEEWERDIVYGSAPRQRGSES